MVQPFFQAIEDNLNEAYEANDWKKRSVLLSDNWTILEPGIGIVNKSDFIKAVKEGKLSHSAMKKEVLHVNRFDNIAIVISRGRNIGHYSGTPFNTELWVTNIYKQENANWVCISTQETPVIGK